MPGKNVTISVLLNLGNSKAQVEALRGQFNGATADVRRFAQGAGELVQKLQPLGTTLSLSVTAPIVALGVSSFNSAKQMDSLTRGLTAVAGSSAEAEKQLGRLKEIAKLPGLGFKEAIQGSISLQAAGISAQFAERALGAFGNALATVGKGKNELDLVNLALTQIANNEFLQGDELNQLREQVPQVTKLLKEAFGTVDTEKLKKAGITSKQVLDTLVAQLERLPKVQGGAQNATENLADAYDQAMTKIGNATLRIAVPAIERLTPAIEKLGNQFAALSPETQTAVVYLGGFAAAAGPVIYGAGAMVGALGNLKVAITGTTAVIGSASAGTGVLGALAAINPVGLAVVGVLAAAGAAWYTYARQTEEAAGQIEQAARRARGAVKLLNGEESREVTLADGTRVNLLPGRDNTINPALTAGSKIKGTDLGFSPLNEDGSRPGVKPKPKNVATGLSDKKGGGRSQSAVTDFIKEAEDERPGFAALTRQLNDVNNEIATLRDSSQQEYRLKVKLESAQQARNDLEELLRLRNEFGQPGNLEQLRGLKAFREQSARNAEVKLATSTPQVVLDDLKEKEEAAKKQIRISELLSQTEESLREQLEDLQSGGDGRSAELSLRRQLRKAGADLTGEREQGALGIARAVDEQKKYAEAVEESARANERFRATVESLFDSLLDSPKRFFEQLKSLAKNFASSTLTNLLLGNKGGAGGGFNLGGGSGGGGLLGTFGNAITGRLTGAIGPGGTAPFNPAGGGFLNQLAGGGNGLLGGLASKGVGALGKLFGLGGGGGATHVASGAVSAAKAALGLGASGAGSAAGAAGAGGGASLASLGALLTNPFTIGIAAGIGGFFLARKLLTNRDLKKLRELARGQYGVDVKDESTLKSIREIGKSTFGKEYDNRLPETVALPTVRELLANYAENTGQKTSLVSRARLQDRYDSINIVRRKAGGIIPGATLGRDYVPALLDGGEAVLNANATRRLGASGVNALNNGAGLGGGGEMAIVIAGLVAEIKAMRSQWTPQSPNDVLMAADARTHAAVTRSGFEADYKLANDLAYNAARG